MREGFSCGTRSIDMMLACYVQVSCDQEMLLLCFLAIESLGSGPTLIGFTARRFQTV